jgi:hypothetical protein
VDYLATVVWFVALMNAFNLIDGVDGLATGIALIAATGIGLSLVFRGQPGDVLLFMGFAGACLGFLRYNYYPANVFLGDTGSLFLGIHPGGAVDLDEFEGVVHGGHRRAAAGRGRAAVRRAAGRVAAFHAAAAESPRCRRRTGARHPAGGCRPSAPPPAAEGARSEPGGVAAVCRDLRCS